MRANTETESISELTAREFYTLPHVPLVSKISKILLHLILRESYHPSTGASSYAPARYGVACTLRTHTHRHTLLPRSAIPLGVCQTPRHLLSTGGMSRSRSGLAFAAAAR